MSLEIFDELEDGLDCSLLQNVYESFLKHFKFKDIFDVEVSIVDEATIQSVNKSSRGVDAITDVLSFPNIEMTFPFSKRKYKDAIDNFSGNIVLGEIMLCAKRAREQATEYGHSEKREVAYLFTHGLLHLSGFDHIDDGDKQIMRTHEEAILGALNITRNN